MISDMRFMPILTYIEASIYQNRRRGGLVFVRLYQEGLLTGTKVQLLTQKALR
jgi:hypothetical protein